MWTAKLVDLLLIWGYARFSFAVMAGRRPDQMFSNLAPLCLSLHIWGDLVWLQVCCTDLDVTDKNQKSEHKPHRGMGMRRPDSVAINRFGPQTKETKQQQGLCMC